MAFLAVSNVLYSWLSAIVNPQRQRLMLTLATCHTPALGRRRKNRDLWKCIALSTMWYEKYVEEIVPHILFASWIELHHSIKWIYSIQVVLSVTGIWFHWQLANTVRNVFVTVLWDKNQNGIEFGFFFTRCFRVENHVCCELSRFSLIPSTYVSNHT